LLQQQIKNQELMKLLESCQKNTVKKGMETDSE